MTGSMPSEDYQILIRSVNTAEVIGEKPLTWQRIAELCKDPRFIYPSMAWLDEKNRDRTLYR